MHTLDFLFLYVETSLAPVMWQSFLPPLGVVSISTYLNEKGFRSKVIDTRRTFFSLDWLEEYLKSVQPKYVGFTMYTDSVFNIKRLISIVRRISPSSKIVSGGAHADVCDEEILKDFDVDIVVRSIGEDVCLQLLLNDDLSKIYGISYVKNGRIKRNALDSNIDLDIYPSPDYHVIEYMGKYPYAPSIVTGRGCPFRCAFCAAGIIAPKVLWRSLKKNMEDINTALIDCYKGILSILDDTFTLDSARIDEFCSSIKENGGGKDILWYAEGHVDTIAKTPRLLEKMADAGLSLLQIGVESGDKNVIKAYNKKINLEDVAGVIEKCVECGIFVHTNFIVGGPFESDKTIEKTRQLAHKLLDLGRGYVQIGFPYLNPLPCTDIYKHPERYGLKLLDEKLYKSARFENCVTETEHLSREEIIWHRWNLMQEIQSKMFEMMKSDDDILIERRKRAKSMAGDFCLSCIVDDHDSWMDFFRTLWLHVFDVIDDIPQLARHLPDNYENMVPVRTSIVIVNEDGYIDFPFCEDSITPLESQIYDFSAGKLTCNEISAEIGADPKSMKQALKKLENIKAICYRTY